MNQSSLIAAAIDPSLILKSMNLDADPWQRDLLLCQDRQIILNCCRQAGKSRTVSALALHTAIFTPGSLTLILSPGQRQSSEVFKKVLEAYNAIGRPVKAEYETQLKIEFTNKSRILCLPGKEETVRCFSPNLLIIDEASRVPDDLYRSVRPMLAVSKGQLVVLSTPFGQRGWFFDEWTGAGAWKRVKITWKEPTSGGHDLAKHKRELRDAGYFDVVGAMCVSGVRVAAAAFFRAVVARPCSAGVFASSSSWRKNTRAITSTMATPSTRPSFASLVMTGPIIPRSYDARFPMLQICPLSPVLHGTTAKLEANFPFLPG
jgi:hypothetical protein